MNKVVALLSSVSLLALVALDANAAPSVGIAAAVNQSAEATPPGESVRTVTLGDNVIHNERITTGEAGLVQILLVDGTTFTIGANSDLTIDKFVYDPDAGTAEVAATLAKGALRFIGGRASKTGGATIATSVGVIGVRGGMTDIILGQEASEGVPENLVNCVYGTCSIGNTTFQAGQSAYPDGSGGVTVVATTPAMAAAGTNQIGSAPGQTGGTSDPPSEETTEESGIAEENSAEPPSTYDQSGETTTTTFTETGPGGDTGQPDVAQDANQGAPPPVFGQPAGQVTIRVLTAPAEYTAFWGGVWPSGNVGDFNNQTPAELGLVGGDGGHDQNVTLDRQTTTNPQLFVGTGNLAQGPSTGTVVLPTYADTDFTVHGIGGATSPFGDLDGTAYSNTDFTFYELFYDISGDLFPFYALSGVPTDFPAVFTGDDVRTYSFTEDPIQGIPVPFLHESALSNFTGAEISDFYVIESPDISEPDSQHVRMLQSWLQISGTGTSQQSGVGVTTGDFSSDVDNEYVFSSGRKGSYRSAASEEAFLLYGGAHSIAGPDGGTAVFGPNGDNLVVSSGVSVNDPFGDNSINEGKNYSTVHVLNLETETPQTAEQADYELFGFTAGMVEESVDFRAGVAPMYSGAEGGFRIQFNEGGNNLGGDLQVIDELDLSPQQSLDLSFGDGFVPTTGGSAVYIDDDLFAATADSDTSKSFATRDGGEQLVYADNNFPVTYMVSSDAVDPGANPAFMGGADICECPFLEWGWWGGQPRLAAIGNTDEEILTQSIHLGTWVAGDIVADHDLLDIFIGGDATYSGHVIGSVVSIDPDDDGDPYQPILNQYIAGGSFDLTWNFGSRTGQIAINFDGRDFGGIVSDPSLTGARFSGNLNGSELTGTLNGAIVSEVDHVNDVTINLNAGVIGTFGVYGVNYYATGTMAGQTVATAPTIMPSISLPLRVLTADDTSYTPSFSSGDPVLDPGQVGLVGDGSGPGEDDNDDIVNTVTYYDADQPPPTSLESGLFLPFKFTPVSTSIDVDTPGEADVDGDPLFGRAFFGPGQFAAYTLLFNDLGDLHPYHAVRGIPTTIIPNGGTGVFEGGGIREYELSDDVIQDIPVPFMRDVAGFDWNTMIEGTDYAETPLYVVNAHEVDGFDPHILQTWIAIVGTGATQVSAIGLNASTIFNDDGDGTGFEIFAGRRGSFRNDANQGSVTMGGSYGTVGNGTPNTNHFFGPNAENFVIGTGGYFIDENGTPASEAFGEFSLDGDADQERFGTMHVATLVDEDVAGIGDVRTERTLSGFVAGVIDIIEETGCSGGVGQNCDPLSFGQTHATGEISINFNPLRDRLGGSMTVRGDVFGEVDPASLTMGFGKIEGEDGNNGKSTFVDDDIFAARESNPTAETPSPSFVESGDGDEYLERPEEGQHTYLVSADAVPLDNPAFMGGEEFCTDCDYMKWGWWGTQGRFEDQNATDDSVYVAAHLGTWVAGERPDPDDLPDTIADEATYNGHAVGNVTNAGANYVAGGDMEMSWNFGNREGAWEVSDFDGKTFGGGIEEAGGPAGMFHEDSGGITGSGITSGSVEGAFTTDGVDPAAGVMGNFQVEDSINDWAATGIFMGDAIDLP